MLYEVITLKKPVMVELSAEMPTDEKLDALFRTVAYISRHNLDAALLLVHDSDVITSYSIHYTKLYDAVSYLSKSVTRSQPFLITCSYIGVPG